MTTYNIDSYRDNTDGKGILRYAKDCFPIKFNHEWNNAQHEMVKLFFMLLDPRRHIAIDRQAYFLVHRECGKTTLGNFGLSSYMIYMKGQKIYLNIDYLGWTDEDREFNSKYLIAPNSKIIEITLDENYITLASETEKQACRYIEALKSTIEERDDLMKVFGEKHPNYIQYTDESRRKKTKQETWTIKAFRTSDGILVEGIGAGVRFRGSATRNFRPSFIILDDIYSEMNTKTDNSRSTIDKWVYAAIKNSLDTQRGKVLWLGTMVHPDTIVKDFTHPDTKWFGIKRPIISLPELNDALKKCTKSGKLVIPSYPDCLEIQKQYKTLSWPTYHPLYAILTKYQENLIKDRLTYFYQEYMNEALAPETIMFPPDTFQKVDFKFEVKDDRQMVSFKYENIEWKGVCNMYGGVDPATSEHDNSDDTVVVVAGYARCYPIVPGREFDFGYYSDTSGKIFPIIAELKAGKFAVTKYKNLPGLAELLLDYDRRYKIDYINVESNGQQGSIIKQIWTVFHSNEDYALAIRNPINRSPRAKIYDEVSTGKKEERIRSILYPIIQQHKTILCNTHVNTDKLYNQLIMIGFADHDDYPDALSIAMKNVKIPKIQNIITDNKNKNNNSRIDNLIEKYGNDWRYYL